MHRQRLLSLHALLLWISKLVASELPARQCLPNPDHPFVLFHQRKTGGSSLRREIYNSAKALGLRALIPCETVGCSEYPHRDWNDEVIAGHFSWGYIFSAVPHHIRKRPTVTCITVFREPFERLRSLFYYIYRAHGDNLFPTWGDFTPDQMKLWLTENFHGTVALNEPIRLFSGLSSDQLVSRLYQYPVLQDQLVNITETNVAKCIVLMQEDLNRPATAAILKYWVPWLNHTMVKTNVNGGKPNAEVLSPEVEAMLREMNAAEFAVYETAKKQYKRQLEYLMTAVAKPC